MSIVTYLAEGVISASYETSRMGSIATGFNLTITDSLDITHDGELEVGIDGETKETYKLGSKKGIILSDGVMLSRTQEGRTTVIVDPIMDLFKKAIVVNNSTTYLEEAVGGENVSSDFMVSLTPADVIQANTKLRNGDILGFIDIMFGLKNGEGNGVIIKTDKSTDSPIVRDLKSISELSSSGGSTKGSFFTNNAIYQRTGLYTVETIYQQTLAPLGLEIYWNGDNKYSLEPPRLTNSEAKSSSVYISNNDIIEINTITDPYNVPDLIIPSTYMPDIVGASGHSVVMQNAIKEGVLSKLNGKRSMKLQTYEIPNFLLDTFRIAMITGKNAIDKTYAPLRNLTDDEAIKYTSTFFGSSARKSRLYKLTRGGCKLTFRPDITIPFMWYTIDGEEYFVTGIRHSISRSSSSTFLTIGGKRNTSIETDSPTPKEDTTVKGIEEKFFDKIVKSTDEKVKTINSYSELIEKRIEKSGGEIHSYLDYSGGDISSDDFLKIFGDKDEMQKLVDEVADVHPTLKV